MMYPGAGISSSTILSAQWTLSFWKFMSFNPGTFSSMILVIFLPIFSFPLIIFHNIHSCHMDMTALMRAHYSFQFPALHIGAGLRSIARMNAIRTQRFTTALQTPLRHVHGDLEGPALSSLPPGSPITPTCPLASVTAVHCFSLSSALETCSAALCVNPQVLNILKS